MKRRDLIVGIGAAALGLARPVAAQQPGALRRLGVLMGYRESDKEAQARLTACFQVFEELGGRMGETSVLSIAGLPGAQIKFEAPHRS